MVGAIGLLGPSGVAAAAGPATCGGTLASPQPLAGGTYTTVTVDGVCAINSGQVVVSGNVTVDAGDALLASYARDAGVAGTTSGLTVDGNIVAGTGATVFLGCEPEFVCFDDPNPHSPTLSSAARVDGSVTGTGVLGIVVHDSTIGGDVVQTGGGGGLTCSPMTGVGPFTLIPGGSPVYSDYEDGSIGGNLRVTGLSSCWFGALRLQIGGSFTYTGNSLADPDASENLANNIGGNILCSDNSPAVQYGDSGSSPNIVGGFATGECSFASEAPNPGVPPGPLAHISVPSSSLPGYWLGAQDGGIFSFGLPFFGSEGGQALAQPIVGVGAEPGGIGYNLADANGTVYRFGPQALDCTGVSGPLNQPVVGIATAPGGDGCWLAAGDGGVFALGPNAPFFGSAGGLRLNKPVVGIAATPGNDGYDLVASDGGVFTYGPGASFYGSMGGKPLNKPIVGIVTDPVTGGYWLVASDGGVFSFNAPFFGSMGGKPLNKPIVGIAAAPTGDGYYLVASDGGIFAFGPGAHFQGSTGSLHLVKPVIGMALG
ncbi:MAG: hypothetical protein WBG41_02230 [Acidimicrobiales bacterium]